MKIKKMKGKELLRLLEASGMSRRELGRELGIADSTVGRWIRGETEIGPVESIGIASYFETVRGVVSDFRTS